MVQRVSAQELLVVEHLIAEIEASMDDISTVLSPEHDAIKQMRSAHQWLEGFASAACWTVEAIPPFDQTASASSAGP